MNTKALLSSLLFFLYCTSSGINDSRQDFIKRYTVNNDIAEILDEHAQELKEKVQSWAARKKKKHAVWTFSWLPNHFIKFNLDRILGMEKMRSCIDKYNLDLIFVPDKSIYHIKGQPKELTNENYLVIVEKVNADPQAEPLSVDHVKQLCKIILKTGYISMSRANYIQTFDNKIALIDTESTFDYKRTLTGLIRLIEWGHDAAADYQEEAFNYILRTIAQLLSHKAHANQHTYSEVLTHVQNIKGPQAKKYVAYFKKLWLGEN